MQSDPKSGSRQAKGSAEVHREWAAACRDGMAATEAPVEVAGTGEAVDCPGPSSRSRQGAVDQAARRLLVRPMESATMCSRRKARRGLCRSTG